MTDYQTIKRTWGEVRREQKLRSLIKWSLLGGILGISAWAAFVLIAELSK